MFVGKLVVITGGGSGIGAALARGFAANGAHVCVGDLNEDAAHRIATDVNGVAVTCDVRCETDVQNLIETAQKKVWGCGHFHL